MGRIVIPMPAARRDRRRDTSSLVAYRPRPDRTGFNAPAIQQLNQTLDTILGVGKTAADLGLAVGGSIKSGLEAARRRRARAAQAEAATGGMRPGPTAFLANALPPPAPPITASPRVQSRNLPLIAQPGIGAPEDMRKAMAHDLAMGKGPRPRSPVVEDEPGAPTQLTRADIELAAREASLPMDNQLVQDALAWTTGGIMGEDIVITSEPRPLPAPAPLPVAAPLPAPEPRPVVQAPHQRQLSREEAYALQQRVRQPVAPQRRPEFIPATVGEARAMVPFARNQEELARALGHVEDLTYATSVDELLSGSHLRAAREAALRGYRPPRPGPSRAEIAAELALAEQRRASAGAHTALAEYRRAQMKALQDEIDKEALEAAKIGKRLRKKKPDLAKAHKEWAFYLANKVKHHRDDIDDDAWRAGAGRFANVDPPGLPEAGRQAGLSRSRLKKATTSVNSIISMMKTRGPAPGGLTQSDKARLRKEHLALQKEWSELTSDIEEGTHILGLTADQRAEIEAPPPSVIMDRMDRAFHRRNLVEGQIGIVESQVAADDAAHQVVPGGGAVYNVQELRAIVDAPTPEEAVGPE